LFGLLFWCVALTTHATSFDVVMYPFVVRFELSQQTLLVVGVVHGGMTMSLQRFFLSSSYMYDIDESFFSVNYCHMLFYCIYAIVAFNLNQIIKLTDLIGFS
jgi:hypothetical protein